jgi:diguanylate cyclase (GGDEF)-like protein
VKRLNTNHRTFIITALVVATGLLLLALIYHHTSIVNKTSKTLTEQDVTALNTTSQLINTIHEHHRLLNKYQTNTDQQLFLASYNENNNKITRLIKELPAQAEKQLLVELHHQTNNLSALLVRALNASIIDRAYIDSLLDKIIANFNKISDHTLLLDAMFRHDLKIKGTQIHAEAQEVIYIIILSGIHMFIISLTAHYYFNKWRRFITFPERNPNPVLSLDEKGMLLYCNPGAMNVTKSLGFTSARELLPAKLEEKLAITRSVEQSGAYWEYKIDNRIFSCRIRHHSDLHCFHIYLADITNHKHTEEKLQHLAYHDSLTNLPNRHSFEKMLRYVLDNQKNGAVLLLRLDRFRFIVEALGHTPADQVLNAVANRLLQSMDRDNPACHIHRFEGNIFAILLPGMTQQTELETFTQKIIGLMRAPFVLDERKLYLSLSIGITLFPEDGNDSNTLLRHADTALQQVKRAGGNSIRRYLPEMDDCSLDRLELVHELRDAEKRGELELYYQPQFDISGETVVGIEALIRWNHPERGMVSPANFIPLAEETDMIISIGEWVLMTACKQNKTWQEAGIKPVTVAVNISPRQFHSPELLAAVRHSLEISQLDACWLELELTEGTAMHDAEITSATLGELKSLGVKLSIDDFGTGYSSLAYLKRFPIDKLKIDQSFIHNMTHENSDAAITKTIITLGQSLGLKLIAEGVENHDQLSMLKEFGCEEIQGYLFSKPLSHTDLSLLLNEKKNFSVQGRLL